MYHLPPTIPIIQIQMANTELQIKKNKENTKVAQVLPLSYADYKANTPAWKNRNKRNKKTGKPIYSIPDSVKNKIISEA